MTAPRTACAVCGDPASAIVQNISRRSSKHGRVVRQVPLCEAHTQAELTLAVTGLSMTELKILPLADPWRSQDG